MKLKLVIIDNYDSFTYNLVQYFNELLDIPLEVIRNDELEVEDLEKFDAIVISPGPGIPSESGKTLEIINFYKGQKPILGVCLGLQAIAESYGGQLKNMTDVQHGVHSQLTEVTNDPIFQEIEQPIQVGRYHSWVVDNEGLPQDLQVIARDEKNEIMAARHKEDFVLGVQFHPESILTPSGKKMINNFLKEVEHFYNAEGSQK